MDKVGSGSSVQNRQLANHELVGEAKFGINVLVFLGHHQESIRDTENVPMVDVKPLTALSTRLFPPSSV